MLAPDAETRRSELRRTRLAAGVNNARTRIGSAGRQSRDQVAYTRRVTKTRSLRFGTTRLSKLIVIALTSDNECCKYQERL